MALKDRKETKITNKFCNVVDELMVLQELGFKEDRYHRWELIIVQIDEDPDHYKSILATSDYLYLMDSYGGGEDMSLCTLWNRNVAGPIKKREIEDFINMLKQGNVRR